MVVVMPSTFGSIQAILKTQTENQYMALYIHWHIKDKDNGILENNHERTYLSLNIRTKTDSVACEHLSLDRVTLESMYRGMLK